MLRLLPPHQPDLAGLLASLGCTRKVSTGRSGALRLNRQPAGSPWSRGQGARVCLPAHARPGLPLPRPVRRTSPSVCALGQDGLRATAILGQWQPAGQCCALQAGAHPLLRSGPGLPGQKMSRSSERPVSRLSRRRDLRARPARYARGQAQACAGHMDPGWTAAPAAGCWAGCAGWRAGLG